jgi:hypothetical protein
MPELDWDETDFIACLEVLPVLDEYEEYPYFEVRKNGMILGLSVRHYKGIVVMSLTPEGQESPLISFSLVVRGKVRYIKDKRGEHLEFNDCVVVRNSFLFELPDVYNRDVMPGYLTLELRIKPQIALSFC